MDGIKKLLAILVLPGFFYAGFCVAGETQTVKGARVRVYQEADISLFPGDFCFGSSANSRVIHAAKTGFAIFGTSRKIGMPETGDIEGSYNEYAVESGKPVSVMLKWEAEKNGVKASCGPIGSTFYPMFGKDYDITVGYNGSCFVQIRELYETSPGKAGARMAPASYSYRCPD